MSGGDLVEIRPAGPSPARVYLASLAPGGRNSVAWQLRQVAMTISGQDDIDAIAWGQMDRQGVIAIMEAMRRRELATATINHCLSVLKRVAEEAWNLGQMDVETYQRIAGVRRQGGERLPPGRAPGREEVRGAIDRAMAGGRMRDLRDAALIAAMAGAGLRCIEAVRLKRSDVQDGRLRLLGKGNKQALQPLIPFAAEVLEEYLDQLPVSVEPLIPRWRKHDAPGDTPLSQSGVRLVLQRWFTDLSPHDLRRGYATWLDEEGHSLSVVQRLLRHSSPTTTMRYVRNEGTLITAVQQLRL